MKIKLSYLAVMIGSICCTTLSAKELSVDASIETRAVNQDVHTDESAVVSGNSNIIEILPSLYLNYETRDVSATWSAKHTYLRRSVDDIDRSDNYTEFFYNGQYRLLDGRFALEANGSTTYRNVLPNNYLSADFLLNQQDLAKTRANNFTGLMDVESRVFGAAQGSLTYSMVESEKSVNGQGNVVLNNLENDSILGLFALRSSDQLDWLDWDFESQYQLSERQDRGDLESRQIEFLSTLKFSKHFGLSVTASHEANQLSSRDIPDIGSAFKEFNTYGVGLSYQDGKSRKITLTANTIDTEGETDGDTFVGVKLNWTFSPLTQIQAHYGKRFFGESGGVSFSHNTKVLRTRLTYDEEVTTYSRLIAQQQSLGVFVCESGNTDIAGCFQPASLNYSLKPGEQFIQFNDINAELNDDVVLRKSMKGLIGFDRNRLNFAIELGYSENDYLEQNRLQRVASASINSGLSIGPYTHLKSTITWSQNTEKGSFANYTADSYLVTAGIVRDIGKSLEVSAEFSYLDRDSDDSVVIGNFYGNIQERRVSIGLKYTYGN